MSEKITVYFILPTLFAGGAERVFLFITQNLNNEKFISKLIVIGFEKDCKYNIEDIPVVFLNKKRVLNGILPIARLLIKDRPKIVVSTIAHLNVIMGFFSMAFPKIKFIGRVSAIDKAPSKVNSFNLTSIMSKISDYGIARLDTIVCQSTDMKNNFLERIKYDETKVEIIRNPITQTPVHNFKNTSNHTTKRFFTVGRLTEIKGHLRILKILSKVKFSFIYTIVGDGILKERIFEQAEQYGISNKLKYIPHTDDVDNIILNNDMFLQGSYSEGFPNALLESCALGRPVIAFNVPGGTKEIVEDGVNGFLVNTEEEFIERLNDTRNWDPTTVSESVYKKFNARKILHQYEEFFLNVLK